jgi:hypothetical protein
MYEALVTEEERLKKLRIEERKAELQAEALELQRLRLQADSARGNGRLLLEALRILRDEALEDRVKVARAVDRLQSWREGAIEVGPLGTAKELVGPGVGPGTAHLNPVPTGDGIG